MSLPISQALVEQRRDNPRGFSLIELLVVIAIMALLLLGAAPAFNSLASAKIVPDGLSQISDFLDMARQQAVARQTYVRAGFLKMTGSDGSSMVKFIALASLDGTGTNLDVKNQSPISRPLSARQVSLVGWGDLKNDTKSVWTALAGSRAAMVSVGANASSFSYQVGGDTYNHWITFTPRGEAVLQGGVISQDRAYDELIDVSLQQTKGTVRIPNGDDGAVVVDGATGILKKVYIK